MNKLKIVSLACLTLIALTAAACQQVDPARQTYENSSTGIAFEYPAKLMLINDSEGVLLRHSLPFVHPDPCDFEGSGGDLVALTDFHVTMQVYPLNLAGTVAATQHSSFVQDYFSDNQFKLSEGYIREYQQGNLRGYEVTQGVEGCGYYLYYFPLEADKTLVVKRAFITELSPISSKREEYLGLPDLIKPEEEVTVFEGILQDFDYMKP